MLQTPLRPEIHRSPANWSDTRRLHITAILKPPDLRQMRMSGLAIGADQPRRPLSGSHFRLILLRYAACRLAASLPGQAAQLAIQRRSEQYWVMVRRVITWFGLLFASVLVTKVLINPVVDRLTADKGGKSALLSAIHWLGSPASDLWIDAAFVIVPCLLICGSREIAWAEKLPFCLPMLLGAIAAFSYRLFSGVVPASRSESIRDPAEWLLVSGVVVALTGLLGRQTWHWVQEVVAE